MKLLLNETEYESFQRTVEEIEASDASAHPECDMALFERAALLTLVHTGAELIVEQETLPEELREAGSAVQHKKAATRSREVTALLSLKLAAEVPGPWFENFAQLSEFAKLKSDPASVALAEELYASLMPQTYIVKAA